MEGETMESEFIRQNDEPFLIPNKRYYPAHCGITSCCAAAWMREAKAQSTLVVGQAVLCGAGGGRGAVVRFPALRQVRHYSSAQPGAAPDRPQCCRFCGFLARLTVGRDWRAAGELSVVPSRKTWLYVILTDDERAWLTNN